MLEEVKEHGDVKVLIQAARQGDDESFLRLMSFYREQLLRIALSYVRSEADALDAIQETTCRAYMNIHKLKEPAYFRTWLIRILIHCCIDEQKRKQKYVPVSYIPEQAIQDEQPEDKLRMQAVIAKLPVKLRHVVILKYYHDMTLTEIASLLNKPEGTIKTWLNKALIKLRIELGEEENRHER